MEKPPRAIEAFDISCECGNIKFRVFEKWSSSRPFLHDRNIGILHTTLECPECGKKSHTFLTSFIAATKEPAGAQKNMQKVCPLCKEEHVYAYVSYRSAGFFDFTEITHTITCSNPNCPWTLESVARSDHRESPPAITTEEQKE